jgi:hypothetical protein
LVYKAQANNWAVLSFIIPKASQAGAELCQAQVKLGCAKNLLPINRKLRSTFIDKKDDVSFDLVKNILGRLPCA